MDDDEYDAYITLKTENERLKAQLKAEQRVLKHMHKAELHVKEPDYFGDAGGALSTAQFFRCNLPWTKSVYGRKYTVSRTKSGTWKVIQE